MKYGVWTLLLWIPVGMLAIAVASVPAGRTVFGVSGGEAAAFLLLAVGSPIYLIGVLVIWWVDRTSGPPSPPPATTRERADGSPPPRMW